MRLGMTTEPRSLSPLFSLDDYANTVDRLAFDVLISVGSDGRTLVPRLAAEVPSLRNGGISRDGRTLTYHLRRNVKWHDGVPFTSKDVAFSYHAIMNPANNVPNRHGYDQIASVATPDPYTVVFRLKEPYAPAITTLFGDDTCGPILPEHLLGRYPNLNEVDFNQHPVGTGPFKVVRWDRGSSVELDANDDYYLGKPKLRRISVRFVPDENTLVTQMRTHELDVFAEMSVNAYGQMRGIPGTRAVLSNVHGAANLLMNTTHDALRDPRVRRAIAAAIDKDAIVRNFAYGAGTVAGADLPSFMWAYDPNARAQPHDPARARAFLRDAGYVPGPGGIVQKAGRPLSLTFAYSQNNIAARLIAVQIQSYLREVGIDAQLKGFTTQMMFNAYAAGGIYQAGKFDLAWYTMTLGVDPDSSGRFTCGAIPPNGQNYSRYCNREMDAAQTAGLRTFDLAARKRAYARSQELLVHDVPAVFVFWPKNIDAADAGLRGFAPNPSIATWNAHEWSW
ncbi:ABC transporter substrate-binding protein [Vulcanimicrobium alpinum]|uniref:ABC transporter substrate-binding protein n=2 Tax=Vulcanimicrobium alpinum TaxID=3016050 RepID=A0AAN2C8I1_UNVUL|nr:ABC transporter substrate-binding protein [Vulcanimicrobium alpinum]